MGSFDYVDFVTGLPIYEWSKKTYVLFVSEKNRFKEKSIRTFYIDDHYKPITFPLFGTYYGYGKFELNNEFKVLNDFALKYSGMNLLEEGHGGEVLLSEDILAEKNLLLSATLHDFYDNVISGQDMPNQILWQGEFRRKFTHKESLDERIQSFLEWKQIIDKEMPKIDEDDFIGQNRLLREHLGHAIIYPSLRDVFTFGEITDLDSRRTKSQLFILEELDNKEEIYQYLLDYFCFYTYLEYIRVPFQPKPSAGLHFIPKDYIKLKEIEMEAAKSIEKEYKEYLDYYS